MSVTETFSTAGTFTWVCPVGVTTVLVKCRQGGCSGGGATGSPAAGGGGAGGAYAEKSVTVTAGLTYTLIVGAAKTGTTGAGAAGNLSSFTDPTPTVQVKATSSAGGGALASVNSTNGAGGTADTTGSVGTTITAGSNGSTGNFTSGASGGQGGQGANSGGAGGTAPADSSAGPAGTAPGGGGSGGKANTVTDRAGGTGAVGRVELVYDLPADAADPGIMPRDWFTGAVSVTSIVGRTPDGGDDPTRAIGNWLHQVGTSGSVRIGSEQGVHGAIRVTDTSGLSGPQSDAHYVLGGYTLPANYGVLATAQFQITGVTSGNFFSVLHSAKRESPECYELIYEAGSGTLQLSYINGSGGRQTLAGWQSAVPSVGVPYAIGLYRVGSLFSVTFQGVLVMAFEDTIGLTGGYAGLCINITSTPTTLHPVITDWETTIAAPPLVTDCPETALQAEYARESFTGSDVADLQGRPLDGGGIDCLTNGRWQITRQNSSELVPDSFIQIESEVARFYAPFATFNNRHYAIKEIPALPDDYAVEATFTVTPGALDALGLDYASVIVLARHDDAVMNGYALEAQMYGGVAARVDLFIHRVVNGIYTPLGLPPGGGATSLFGAIPTDTPLTLKLCIQGNQFCAFYRGQFVRTVTDDVLSGGYPGLGMWDAVTTLGGVFTGATVAVTLVRVISDEASAPLCGGSGSGHAEPPTETVPTIWPVGKGAWRPILLPTDLSTSHIRPFGQGSARHATPRAAYSQGAWRVLQATAGGGNNEFNGDPGDTYPDPGCGQIAVPTIPITPYAGSRLFFCYQLPLEGATDPFDTAVWAMGPWVPGHLSILAARGMHEFTSVGGYDKYQDAGGYEPSLMNAWIDSHAPYMPTILSYFPTTWFGQIAIDDWRSTERWGASRPHAAEVNRIGGYWKSKYGSGIRIILRDTPEMAHLDDTSETFSNIDCFYCQYVDRYGEPRAWMDRQIAQALAWGGKELLFGWNFLHLHSLTSGATVSDILDIGTYYANEPYCLGIGGWQYDLSFLNQPGMVDALTTIRNLQAANWP